MSENKYSSSQSLVWISKNQDKISGQLVFLKDKKFDIKAAHSFTDWRVIDEAPPSIFIINTDECDDINQDIRQIKESTESTIIGIINPNNSEQKEELILSGLSACLVEPLGHNELFTSISHFTNSHKKAHDFKTQLDEASQMALLAMENSSDLGAVISFIKKAMISKSYADLAENIFKATELDCETCLLEIKGHDSNQYFSASKENNTLSQNDIDRDMQQYLLSQKKSGRIVKIDNILQINQSNLTILLDGMPYQDSHRMTRLSDNLVVLSDVANRIAEKLATEESLRVAEKERQRFLNTLSHELRTPLNSILGFSKALKSKDADKSLGKSGFEALGKIIESTEQVNAIISTLIEISGNTSREHHDHNQKIDVDNILIRLQNDFKQAALDKQLSFEIHSPEGLHLFSDSGKVYNILKRLVDNAIKFTSTGKISIQVTTDSPSNSQQLIIFKIEDTGIGIETKNHEKIFKEIGQLNTDNDRCHYGIGLGLYYARLVAQQINGTLSVQSTLNQGSEFSLSLPFTTENKPDSAESDAPDINTENIDDLLF